MKNFLSNYLETLSSGAKQKETIPGPVITISRDCGCSAKRIATKLSKILTGYIIYLKQKRCDGMGQQRCY
jgi:hypothetical protein